MTNEQQLEGFDDTQYRPEAEQRWGLDVVAESYRRMSQLSKEEQAAVQAEPEIIAKGMAACMALGPAAPQTQALVARHYASNKRFWDCTPEAYRNLGQLYVDDPRFAAFYENIKPGLAAFMRDAMNVYADKA